MKRNSTRPRLLIAAAVILNAVSIYLVVASVVSTVLHFRDLSFMQNIENIRTLTNASANKVELVIDQYAEMVSEAADYISNYRDTGMTEEEVHAYFLSYYGDTGYNWQLVNGESSNPQEPSQETFWGKELCNPSTKSIGYNVNYYAPLAVVFSQASPDTLLKINYINEFTDVSSLEKSFAVSCAARVRIAGAEGEEDSYVYKTLMLVVKSADINTLIANNNINNLDFSSYANAIIDSRGNYVFSNENFPGTNFFRYLETYDSNLTKEEKTALMENLETGSTYEPIFYKNNRGKDCVYSVSPVSDTNWYILSMVPVDSFHNVDNYSGSYMRFFLAFMMFFLIDIVFVLIINRQLKHRTKEAQAASVAKSRFLSSMSHDIRTPMNAIIGMTAIADQALAAEPPDQDTLQDCIKTIELSGNHLLTLINDVLDISKIESGKVALSDEDFSISETMSKMLEIIQPQIKEKNFDFETHIVNVEHEFVHADELRINQIYINILSNAVKYTNPGGKITVDLREEAIPGKTDRARFVYCVCDNGIGMDEEFQKTLFDRFTRAVDTRINRVQGTGLGMSIVKQLIDLMGGTITVKSALNVGSTFTVTLDLPLADVLVETVSLHNRSALLIDDDPVLPETAGMYLKKVGMTVASTESGREGIRMAVAAQQAGHPYDVILVDWKMTEMSGSDVIQNLRTELGSASKILLMTAYSIADIEREAHLTGVDGYISKPLFQSKLVHAIQSLFTEGNHAASPAAEPHFTLRVLVAEDNNVNWKVMDKLLHRYGVQAERAYNGREAVDLVKAQLVPYDLILMDIQMPVMNGYAATEAIRSLENTAQAATPIYAMTADTFAEDVAKCMKKGMDGHLSKPIEIDKLLKVLTLISKRKENS